MTEDTLDIADDTYEECLKFVSEYINTVGIAKLVKRLSGDYVIDWKIILDEMVITEIDVQVNEMCS